MVPLLELLPFLLAAYFLVAWYRRREGRTVARDSREKASGIRLGLFTVVLIVAFAFALLFLPNKQRILVIAPVCFLALGMISLWVRGQRRARREARFQADLDAMKRVRTL